jgi:hypothetical protein
MILDREGKNTFYIKEMKEQYTFCEKWLKTASNIEIIDAAYQVTMICFVLSIKHQMLFMNLS